MDPTTALAVLGGAAVASYVTRARSRDAVDIKVARRLTEGLKPKDRLALAATSGRTLPAKLTALSNQGNSRGPRWKGPTP